jgi:hypothetical protein
MKSLLRFLPFALILVSLAPAVADEKTNVERIISVGRTDNRVMEHLDILCNRFGARLTSSDNLQNASEWVRDTFASFGLADARLEEWGQFPVGFNRGPWFGRMVEPAEKSLRFGTHAWTAGTKGVQRGRALFPPENDEELERMRGILPGAWILARRPGSSTRPDAEFSRKLDDAYKTAKIGGIVRSVGGELIMTFGSPPPSWDKLPTTPNINMVKKDYDEIAGLVAEGKEVVLEFDIRNYFKRGPVKLYNVIADLPGTEWPDEYVIVGGHIDSWDAATGAMDNGTGVAAVMEAARILTQAEIKPRRTIRFMLWSGEEQGLLGSLGYIKKNPDLMKKISAVLVDDGGTNYVSGIQATEAMVSDFEQCLAPIKTLDAAMPFEIQKVRGLPYGIGSDHDAFLGAGVPGFYLKQRGRANYNRIHHTQFDTFEGAIPEYQQHSSIVIALAAYGIANLDHMLSRENLRAAPFSVARRPNPRRMGVQLDELDVLEVMDGSVAAKAGIRDGDRIVKVDGKKISNRAELQEELQKGEPKKTVTVSRDGQEKDVVLEWLATPAKKAEPPAKNDQ